MRNREAGHRQSLHLGEYFARALSRDHTRTVAEHLIEDEPLWLATGNSLCGYRSLSRGGSHLLVSRFF